MWVHINQPPGTSTIARVLLSVHAQPAGSRLHSFHMPYSGTVLSDDRMAWRLACLPDKGGTRGSPWSHRSSPRGWRHGRPVRLLERDRSHMIRSTKLVIFFHFHHYLFSVTFIIIIIITFVNCCYVLTSFLFSWLLLLVALTLCFDVTVHHDRVKHVVIVALYITIYHFRILVVLTLWCLVRSYVLSFTRFFNKK